MLQVAISASNTGGAWDNAKKYIEVDSVFQLTFHSALIHPDSLQHSLTGCLGQFNFVFVHHIFDFPGSCFISVFIHFERLLHFLLFMSFPIASGIY